MKKYENNIFEVLEAIDKKDESFFDNLTEAQKKDLSPYMLTKWLQGTTDASQIYFLNQFVNHSLFTIQNHKDFLIQLMTICTDGKKKRYKWQKPKKGNNFSKSISVIKEYFKYNEREAKEALPLLSARDILTYAEYLGRQEDDIKQLRKELEQRKGTNA